MCLKNDCNHGCRNQNNQDTTNLKCEIGRLYKLIGELNTKIDPLQKPEKAVPREAKASEPDPWFANKSPEVIATEILKASKYIFDKNIEVSFQPAGDGRTFGLEFKFKIHHTEQCSSILAEESFYCPICVTFDITVQRFDALCEQMHTIRLRHEDEPKAIEAARKQAQQNFIAFRHLLKDIVIEVLGEKHTESRVVAHTKEEMTEYCGKLYSSREGKELLIRNSKYAISPARFKVGKVSKNKKGAYIPMTFFSEGKGAERKSEIRKLYVDNGVTHQAFDKLVASLKVVKFNLRKPAKVKKGGK